jgi:hypothetical protein
MGFRPPRQSGCWATRARRTSTWRCHPCCRGPINNEFYARFYQGSDIPRDIPVRVRDRLLELDGLADRLVPTDCLPLLVEELDYADVLRWVGREFEVRFTRADYPAVDGTLDNLIRLVHVRLE